MRRTWGLGGGFHVAPGFEGAGLVVVGGGRKAWRISTAFVRSPGAEHGLYGHLYATLHSLDAVHCSSPNGSAPPGHVIPSSTTTQVTDEESFPSPTTAWQCVLLRSRAHAPSSPCHQCCAQALPLALAPLSSHPSITTCASLDGRSSQRGVRARIHFGLEPALRPC